MNRTVCVSYTKTRFDHIIEALPLLLEESDLIEIYVDYLHDEEVSNIQIPLQLKQQIIFTFRRPEFAPPQRSIEERRRFLILP